jgi:hypothetical protein
VRVYNVYGTTAPKGGGQGVLLGQKCIHTVYSLMELSWDLYWLDRQRCSIYPMLIPGGTPGVMGVSDISIPVGKATAIDVLKAENCTILVGEACVELSEYYDLAAHCHYSTTVRQIIKGVIYINLPIISIFTDSTMSV